MKRNLKLSQKIKILLLIIIGFLFNFKFIYADTYEFENGAILEIYSSGPEIRLRLEYDFDSASGYYYVSVEGDLDYDDVLEQTLRKIRDIFKKMWKKFNLGPIPNLPIDIIKEHCIEAVKVYFY